jgi:hypothetical protein
MQREKVEEYKFQKEMLKAREKTTAQHATKKTVLS